MTGAGASRASGATFSTPWVARGAVTVESHRNGQTRKLAVTTERAAELLEALSA